LNNLLGSGATFLNRGQNNPNSSIVKVYFGKVIGAIWATQKDASLVGETLQLVQPLDAAKKPLGSPIAAVNSVGAGAGETVMFVTSSEAAIPIRSRKQLSLVPTDATIVGIVDRIDVVVDSVIVLK
jgi:ethanolamine utilization protein EutN